LLVNVLMLSPADPLTKGRVSVGVVFGEQLI